MRNIATLNYRLGKLMQLRRKYLILWSEGHKPSYNKFTEYDMKLNYLRVKYASIRGK